MCDELILFNQLDGYSQLDISDLGMNGALIPYMSMASRSVCLVATETKYEMKDCSSRSLLCINIKIDRNRFRVIFEAILLAQMCKWIDSLDLS